MQSTSHRHLGAGLRCQGVEQTAWEILLSRLPLASFTASCNPSPCNMFFFLCMSVWSSFLFSYTAACEANCHLGIMKFTLTFNCVNRKEIRVLFIFTSCRNLWLISKYLFNLVQPLRQAQICRLIWIKTDNDEYAVVKSIPIDVASTHQWQQQWSQCRDHSQSK